MKRSFIAVAFAFAFGCSSDRAVDVAADADVRVDERQPVPAPDPAYVDLVTPEYTLAAGEEKIFCYTVDGPVDEFASDGLITEQGASVHHIALRTATTRQPNGTLEDCTHTEAGLDLSDTLLGPGTLPDGWAIHVAADTQFVIESHYINSKDSPIVARDVLRIHRRDPATVERWVSMMHLKTYDLIVPPGETTRAFTCTTSRAITALQLWGHQHGLGTHEEVTAAPPGGAASSLYAVRWGTDPLVLAGTFALPAGTELRVSCTWSNPSSQTILFPDEMCAFGGLLDGDGGMFCVGETQ